MLRKVGNRKVKAAEATFVIVASRYNARYVDSMVRAAQDELKKAGGRDVRIIRVPGAFEIPVVAGQVAQALATGPRQGAIICLGVILRGATTHAEHIGRAVSHALMELQLRYGVPVIHEVLLLENREQARERCLDWKQNRGREAARTALEMVRIMRELAYISH